MSKLLWNQLVDRHYEAGLDRGVLYLPDDSAIAWNGLTGLSESFADDKTTPIYFDGMKIHDLPIIGDYQSQLSAFTYPEEFEQFNGFVDLGGGVFGDNQPTSSFGLSYRTYAGDAALGLTSGYRIHILYNLTAIPTDHNHATLSSSVSPDDFSWGLHGRPIDVPGYAPTAHVIFDSRAMHPILLTDLEDILYGSSTTPPRLPPISELIDKFEFLIRITDHGDGSWSASGPPELVVDNGDGTYEIDSANAIFMAPDFYTLSDTPA